MLDGGGLRPGRPLDAWLVSDEHAGADAESAAGEPPDGPQSWWSRPWSRSRRTRRTGRDVDGGPCRLSPTTIGRIWRRFDLTPHLDDRFNLSTDPMFVAKSSMSLACTTIRPRRRSCYASTRIADAGAGPLPAAAADDAGHARTAHPRLRPPRLSSLFAAFNIADAPDQPDPSTAPPEIRSFSSRSTRPYPPIEYT